MIDLIENAFGDITCHHTNEQFGIVAKYGINSIKLVLTHYWIMECKSREQTTFKHTKV